MAVAPLLPELGGAAEAAPPAPLPLHRAAGGLGPGRPGRRLLHPRPPRLR